MTHCLIAMTSTFALICLALVQATHTQIPIHIVSGIKFEEIPTLTAYQSSVPLIYKVPYHTKISNNFPKLNHPLTSCDNLIKNQYQECIDKNILNKLQTSIHDILNLRNKNTKLDLHVNQPTVPKRTKRAIDFIGRALSWCCNVATMTNLNDLSKNEVQVDDKLNHLLDFVKEENHEITVAETKMNNFTNNINSVLEDLHSSLVKYDSTFKINMNQSTKIFETKLEKYTQETWLYIYLTLYYSRLDSIEQDCQNNKIPQDLVAVEELRADLEKLQQKLLKQNLTLAIPVLKTYQLYNLKISKCHYEGENIVLQIKIPVLKNNITYKAYTYNPIPLKWENKICTLINSNFIIIATNKQNYIVNTDNNKNCDYKSSNLCLIPRFISHSSPASRCATYMIKGSNLAQLKDYCEFHCIAQPDHPIITQLDVNKFLITNIEERLTINCNNHDLQTKIPQIEIGTVEVELPCFCNIQNDKEIIIESVAPCDTRDYQKTTINHLIPLPWTNLENLKIDPFDLTKRTEFENYTNLIVPNWNITTPTFTVKNLEKQEIFEHINVENKWSDIVDDRRLIMYLLVTWNIILTFALLVSAYNIHMNKIRLGMLQPPSLPPRQSHRSMVSLNTE